QGGEGLDLRVFSHPRFIAITLELAAHDLFRIERPDSPEQAQLFRLHRLRIVTGWGVYREQRDDLQQVVLHNIANGADLLVEGAPAFHAELLSHGDLYVL